MIYLYILLICFLFYYFLEKYFRTINVNEAIGLLRKELEETQVTNIIKELPWKYHHSYWLNIIYLNILNQKQSKKYKNYGINIKELGLYHENLPKRIKLYHVISYINKSLREEKKIEKKYVKEGKIKDTSSVSELKSIEELENNLAGTVDKNDKKLNEKLLMEVRVK